MKWTTATAAEAQWPAEISGYEEKLVVARKVAAKVEDGDVIGAGSGSTSFLALREIALRARKESIRCTVIPTSREIEVAAGSFGLLTTSLLQARPVWCFDGADEVDGGGNLIKGRGGAMFREKLIMRAATTALILVDKSKFVTNLGGKFPVPVEVVQESLHYAATALQELGAVDVTLRPAQGKDGPVVTETGNLILDCKFNDINCDLEKEIKQITGVVESGLFWGFKPEIITG